MSMEMQRKRQSMHAYTYSPQLKISSPAVLLDPVQVLLS